MKKSNEPSKSEPFHGDLGEASFDLDLPDGSHFDPEPRRSDPVLCIKLCEHWLPILMARPSFWERREADRCLAEFDLADPSRVPVSYPAEFIDEMLRR